MRSEISDGVLTQTYPSTTDILTYPGKTDKESDKLMYKEISDILTCPEVFVDRPTQAVMTNISKNPGLTCEQSVMGAIMNMGVG